MFLLYKNNDNIQNYNNHKGIKLLSHILKFRFVSGRSTSEVIRVLVSCNREIKDIYNEAKTQIRLVEGDPKHFSV
ncbi:hypothetical protein H5410_026364 [Solanum commersonii]|uniref:Uncharacterized protein n=1 Tax=Solanum commersonii TaxID=4109 RepID=A0A9J5YYK6_SOLCO|nr:hypothetical protein H5410_026364 [Solanum commersonii]